MSIIGGLMSGKTTALLNLINHQPDIDKISLYANDFDEPKYQLLIKKRHDVGIKHLNNPREFIKYPNTVSDVYNNIEYYSIKSYRKTLKNMLLI